jgi:hypothetical protein
MRTFVLPHTFRSSVTQLYTEFQPAKLINLMIYEKNTGYKDNQRENTTFILDVWQITKYQEQYNFKQVMFKWSSIFFFPINTCSQVSKDRKCNHLLQIEVN